MIRTILFVCVFSLAASGCGVKLVYNNLDRIARWSVSDYLQMDQTQRAYFDAEVDRLLYWHRTTQLPQYANFLESLESALGDGTDEQEILAIINTMFGWGDAIEARGMPMIIELLLSMNDEQVAALPALLTESNRDFMESEEDASVSEMQKEWQREFVDGFSRIAGKLNREQKDYLTAQSVRYIPQYGLWVEYRQRWQAELLRLLREERDDPAEFGRMFVALNESRKSYYGAELTGVFAHNEALYQEATVYLINNLSVKQQNRFFSRMNSVAEDFRELVAEAPEQEPASGGCLVVCSTGY